MKRIAVVIMALALTLRCGEEEEPSGPGESRWIEGDVLVESVLTDTLGNNMGTVDSPLDGVTVLLMQGGNAVDSTRTEEGEYDFNNVAAGTYAVMARITDEVLLASDSIEVTSPGAVACDPVTFAACVNQTVGLTVAVPYPNPFETGVTIAIMTFQQMGLEVEVWNTAGQMVRTIVDAQVPGGLHTVTWDGTSSTGGTSPAGVYFVVVRGNGGEYFSYASCTKA